jgi:regulator of sirC expression with transglutaminase-like and TPR domain
MNNLTRLQDFYQEISQKDEKISLAKACLYYAQTEYPNLDVFEYLNALDTMAEELEERIEGRRYPLKVLSLINQYLYQDLGFAGNTIDYYDPRNSYLNEVIERRLGIPITLAVVYLEIAQRIDFPMQGIGMPGHFLIRPNFEGVGIFVDPFKQGEILFEEDCQQLLNEVYQQPMVFESRFLEPVSNRQILARIMTNLKYIHISQQELNKALKDVQAILLLFPDTPKEIRDRGLLYYQLEDWQNASDDLTKYLSIFPDSSDAQVIRQLLDKIN